MSPYVPRSDCWVGLKATFGIALVLNVLAVPLLWMGEIGLLLSPIVSFLVGAGLAAHAAGYTPWLGWLIGSLMTPWFLASMGALLGPEGVAAGYVWIVAITGLVGACLGNLIGIAQRYED